MRKKVWLIGPRAWSASDCKLSKPDHLIFIDGGLSYKSLLPVKIIENTPLFSLGDGDSLREHGVKGLPPLDMTFSEDKDKSDFSLALEHLPEVLQTSFENDLEFSLLGLLGGRKDHELAVLGESYHFLKKNKKCFFQLYDSLNILEASMFYGEMKFNFHGTFSVFSFNTSKVEIKGEVKFPTKTEMKPFQSLGLSNEAHGEFTVKANEPLLIYWAKGKERT
ncbi:MAG: hypothetical protein NXH75_06075 [Halobacteriovoraceae bacterium]|nr:hypothetical protein [Halobacteriovoraceae bacterium]